MVQINESKFDLQWQAMSDKYLSNLSDLPPDCVFSLRKTSKIPFGCLVQGFILMLLKGGNSLNVWAMQIGSLGGFLLSKQGLSKKLHMGLAYFVSQILSCVLRRRLQETVGSSVSTSGLLSTFTNVYLEDSTCIRLPDNLSAYFPSSYSKLKTAATARLQVCLNLKSHHFTSISLQSYRDNDQKHANSIVSILKKGDLTIRDLGYAVLSAFKAIISVEAFFLSRLRSDVLVYLPNDSSEKALDLYKFLSDCDKKGQTQVDIAVEIGKKEKLPVRWVALKLPENVANERRRKANQNRDKRLKPTDTSRYLLGWVVFVTNVSKAVWQPTDLAKVYRMRWRIEIVFKMWKSNFQFNHIFQTSGMTYPRALISFYLLLLFLTLFFVNWFDYFFNKIIEKTKDTPRWLSIFKFAQYIKLEFENFLKADFNENLNVLSKNVQYYCCYDKRKRPNQMEVLYYYF